MSARWISSRLQIASTRPKSLEASSLWAALPYVNMKYISKKVFQKMLIKLRAVKPANNFGFSWTFTALIDVCPLWKRHFIDYHRSEIISQTFWDSLWRFWNLVLVFPYSFSKKSRQVQKRLFNNFRPEVQRLRPEFRHDQKGEF